MTVITLLTDFGLRDGYPGVMKGVILNIAPDVKIADICHNILPQDIRQGALILARTANFFPDGTIHVAVVDPGVGTSRRPIGLHLDNQFFIGPDNGLFTMVLEQAENNLEHVQVVHLTESRYWLPEVSHVFHGRDIFSPCAAHLATGISLNMMGTAINDPVRLFIQKPVQNEGGGISGHVVEIDSFGNISTDIVESDIRKFRDLEVVVAGHHINGLVPTFGARPTGSLVALIGTSHELMIAIVNGDAAKTCHISVGDPIDLLPRAAEQR